MLPVPMATPYAVLSRLFDPPRMDGIMVNDQAAEKFIALRNFTADSRKHLQN